MNEKLHKDSEPSDIVLVIYDPFKGKNVQKCRSTICGGPECLQRKLEGTEFKMIDGHVCGAGTSFDLKTNEDGLIIGATPRKDCLAVFAKPEENPEFFQNQPELLIRG